MKSELNFYDKVVVVTGEGTGLGRCHAIELGCKGVMLVVNDLGGRAHGDGESSVAADLVVDEIKSIGGQAY